MPRHDHPTITSLAAACDAVFTLDAPALAGLVPEGPGFALCDGPVFGDPDDLIGFSAPSHWCGLAFVATGTAHHLDRGRAPDRARVTYALHRDGRSAGSVTTASGTTRLGLADGAAVGRIADYCHRILGLAAPAEASRPADVLPRRARRRVDVSWADLHDHLVSRQRGWFDLSPAELAWMDAPTFARYLLGSTSSMTGVHAVATQAADSVRGDPGEDA